MSQLNGEQLETLDHWLLPQPEYVKREIPDVLVYQASTRNLRIYWQEVDHMQRRLPPPRPPLSVAPAEIMSPAQWKRFWNLNMPHGVRNCWWRLLIHKLSTRITLQYCDGDTPVCKISLEDIWPALIFKKKSFQQVFIEN
ncbi:hypothetical protein BC941DRAFT_458129 [Chlamydoabsidia padenii]|nr:hypothetical protein BC941DRAFT_458129 [Chlamydoabsidia padenii]